MKSKYFCISLLDSFFVSDSISAFLQLRLRLSSKLIPVFLTAAMSGGCGAKPTPLPPMQVDGEDAIPSAMPTADQILAVTAPNYKRPVNARSECFGRVVFEVSKEVQWPLYFAWQDPDKIFNRSFGQDIGDPGDTMRFGGINIAVIGSVAGVNKERVFESTPAALEKHLIMRIGETREFIFDTKKNRKISEADVRHIDRAEEWIANREETIREIRDEFGPYDPGLPASQGYSTSKSYGSDETNRYSILRAYLTRGEHIFIFESEEKMNTPADMEAHKRHFSSLLAKFRTRSPNEIPVEPGVCFPFGFIPDDGRTVVEFKQSLRYHDAPGVLYTIETGTVHPRRMKPTMLTATAHASINPPPASEEYKIRPEVTQRIGPHFVKMGGVHAMQGGVVLKGGTGDSQYDIYSIYSGYSGWLGTAVLPYILVEMQTVNRYRAPELTQNPPPFKHSKDRLDTMLKSMRWRPTNPPMPEFQRK